MRHLEPQSSSPVDLRLNQYLQLVAKWNPVAGLVSAGDLRHLDRRHLQDSLALGEFITNPGNLLDVGSGGGFPGIPLAITYPAVSVQLVERNKKKCSFLRHVIMVLELENAMVIESDVRSIKREPESVDAITARAVREPQVVWDWCKKLLGERGVILIPSASPLSDTIIKDVDIESRRSSGIGWVNILRRRTA